MDSHFRLTHGGMCQQRDSVQITAYIDTGVGMSEEALQAAGIPYRAVKLPMAYSGRFVAENEGVNGVCKVLAAEDGTVLGAHMLGNPASELIVLAGMAIEDGKTIEDWKRYVFPHPTVGEIFREL